MKDENYFDFSSGLDKVYTFIDKDFSAVMTKVVALSPEIEKCGDPVELTSSQARELAAALLELANRLDRYDEQA